MKITMYELLGMLKDGKAPKRIKQTFDDGFKEEYILDNEGWFETLDGTTKMNIFKIDRLNSIVEIIEEDKKIEKLEKFDIQGLETSGYSMTQAEYLLEEGIQDNRNKINELIDYINNKD